MFHPDVAEQDQRDPLNPATRRPGFAPTKRAAAYVGGAAVVAVLLPRWFVAVLIVGVLAAAAVDGYVARRPPETTRRLPGTISRGVPADLSIDVAGPVERIRVRQPGTPDLLVDPSISDGGLDGTVTALRRGAHTLPPVTVRVTGPLGLATRTMQLGSEHHLSVFPDMPAARHIAARVRHGLFRTEGNRIRGRLGIGTAFETIREYVDGDDARHVNWSATSRFERPMVNQFRVEQDRDVMCLIDCGRLMGAPIGDLSRLDAAIDAAAAVGAVADVVGDRVGVVAFDDEILRDLPPLRRGGDALARAIHDLEPSPDDSNYRLAFERVAASKRAFVVVLTDLLDVSAARPLVEAIPVLARRHAVAVASVTDPDVARALEETPESIEDAARAAVAADVLESRRAAVLALERHGARVIDVSRAHLSAAVVAGYLDAKDRVRF